jgi:glycosyltransferase involved in cell wall biosynthesis
MIKKQILFIYPNNSTFVKNDYEILAKKFRIKKHHYVQSKSILRNLICQLLVFIFFLKNIRSSAAIFVWFADYHSFLPVLFGKIFSRPSFIVIGGYDVTYLPSIKYGSFSNPIRSYCAKYSLENASLNLAVSDNLVNDAHKYVSKININVLYTGYSHQKLSFETDRKKIGIISVCGAFSLQRVYLKGVDLIIETAKILPNEKFLIIAADENLLRSNFEVPQNIEVVASLPHEQLIAYYQNASVYIQLSLREGLPNSVCESMLCGCIPVGTNSGGIPIAIGDAGFIVDHRDPKLIADSITKALNCNLSDRIKARQRVINLFSLENRETQLLKKINSFLIN